MTESSLCRKCRHATEDVRRSLIEGMWANGWLTREIADALDTNTNSISVTIIRMRKVGWSVPHRYSTNPR